MLAAEVDKPAKAGRLAPHLLFSSLNAEKSVALAVSGGSDSMGLLRLVAEWLKDQPKPPSVVVLTVDHGLRAEAAGEAAQVARWSQSLGFPHVTLTWRHGAITSGLQAKARQARYDLMTQWCLAEHVGLLLTAHTLDDQAETVAMRQRRTATDASLAGIWRQRSWNGVSVLRPLLEVRRNELRHYLTGIGQGWLEDPSNSNDKFERIRVRQALAGKAGDTSVLLAGAAKAAALRHDQRAAEADDWLASQAIWREGYASVERSAFAELKRDVACLIISKVILALGGLKVSPGEAQRLVAWLLEEKTGARRSLGGCLFAKRAKSFLVGREPGRISSAPAGIGDTGQLVWDGRFVIHAPAGARVLPAGNAVELAGANHLPAFVRQGWPVVLGEDGTRILAQIEFIPCLR